MQKAILPLRYIGISQPMYGKTSHISLKAIDFGWNSNYYEQSTVLLAPFDGKVVWKKGSSNTIAFQSNEKVEYADGTVDYMTNILQEGFSLLYCILLCKSVESDTDVVLKLIGMNN